MEIYPKYYTNAWSSVKNLVKTASDQDMGVLLDLHALPGGANADSHSGTSSKEVSLWKSSSARKQATDCILFIAEEAVADEQFGNGLVGIQIVNEAKYKAPGMFEWYDSVLDSVTKVNQDIPVYVSDVWDLGPALSWTQKRNGKGKGNPVVVDTHKYFCFGGPNADLNPKEIIEKKVPELFTRVDVSPSKLTSVVVGEWSCVLGEKAWGKVGKEERGPLTKKYGLAQSRRWFEKTGGSFFWTWKMVCIVSCVRI
jgi:aryl-phospho-beta-D-glucosidase BglC (GH1 family)